MSCEICGRNSCSKMFHSLESQEEFDNVADDVKDRMKAYIENKLNRLDCHEIEGESGYFINLEDALSIVDDYS